MAGLEKHFGAWKAGEVPALASTEPPDATRRVIVIDKKDSVQTEIRVGHIAIPRKHNDFEAIDQAVKILGGEGANRLQQVLRSQKQLTYGASADLDTYKWAGAVIAETDTQTPKHRRSVAGGRRRIHAAAARARLRRRARRRAGLHGRSLPVDDRSAGCDRDPGPQSAVLRAAGGRSAEVSGARAAGDARRDSARRAVVHPAGAAVGRAGRRCRQVRQRSERRRLRHLRAHSDRAPRSAVRRSDEAHWSPARPE